MDEIKNFGYFGEEITTSTATVKPQDSEEKQRVVTLSIESENGSVEAFMSIPDAKRLAYGLMMMAVNAEYV